MRLVGAEFGRLFARRFTRIMLVAVLVIMAAIGLGLSLHSTKQDAATYAKAVQSAQNARAGSLAEVRKCNDSQVSPQPDPAYPVGYDCAALEQDQADPRTYEPYAFSFREDTAGYLLPVGALLAALAYAVGASFVGTEWSSAGMMNLLLWVPRRFGLLGGKLTALLLGMLTSGGVILGGWTGYLWLLATTNGATNGTTAGVWQSLLLTDARMIALVLAAAAIGFGLASLGRHTATALGAAIGYLILIEAGLRLALVFARAYRPERFELSSYVSAWMRAPGQKSGAGGCGPTEPNCSAPWHPTLSLSAVVLCAVVALVLGWAFLSFRRRDVT
jgi:hypothetical protein